MNHISRYARKTFLVGLILLIFGTALGLVWLGNSQSGLRWIIHQLQPYVPGQLSIESAEGKVFGHIVLKQLQFEDPQGLKVNIDKFILEWDPIALSRSLVSIKRFQIENITVWLPPGESAKENQNNPPISLDQLPSIQLPVQIEIQTVALEQLEIYLPKQVNSQTDSIKVASLGLQEIKLREVLSIAQVQLNIPEQPQIPSANISWNQESILTPPYQTQMALDWSTHVAAHRLPKQHFPEGVNAAGQLQIKGDLNLLQITHQLSQPLSIKLQAQLKQLISALEWNSEISWQHIDWPMLPSQDKLLSLKDGIFKAKGNLEAYSLQLRSRIESTQFPSGRWSMEGNGDFKQFEVESLMGEILAGKIETHGQVSWQPQITANLASQVTAIQPQQWNAEIPVNTPVDAKLKFHYKNQKLNIEQIELKLPETQAIVQVDGHISNLETDPLANLKVQWENLRWPITDQIKDNDDVSTNVIGEALFRSSLGQLDIQGGLEAFHVKFATQASGKDIPPGDWQGRLQGNLKQLESFQIDGQLLQGSTTISGKADWSEYPQWEVNLSGKGIKPENQWPDIPGVLNFAIDHTGSLQQEQLNAWGRVSHLQGKIKGYPIRLKGEFSTDGTQHHIKKLDFYSGKNRINAWAKLSTKESLPQIDAWFKINAPQLATFLPNAKGEIRGEGRVKGSLKQPDIDANLWAKRVQFEQWNVKGLKAKMLLVPQQKGNLDIKLDVKEVSQQQEIRLKKLNLTAKGKINQHQIRLNLDTPKEQLRLGLTGGANLDALDWRGVLGKLQIESPQLGNWYLAQSSSLLLSGQKASLQQSCFKAKQHVGKICSALTWEQGIGAQFTAGIKQLSLSQMAEAFLPPHIGLTGMVLNGGIQAQLIETKIKEGDERVTELSTPQPMKIQSTMDFSLTQGKLFTLLEGRQYILPFKGAKLDGVIDERGLSGQVGLKLFDKSTLNGNWQLSHFNQLPLKEEQPIQGKIQTRFLDLDILPSLTPLVKNTQGQLKLEAQIDGTLQKPRLDAQMALQAAMDIPKMGLALKNIRTQVTTQNQYTQLKIEGGLNSGEGFSRFDGMVDLSNLPTWEAKLKLYGEQFRAIHNDDFKVWIAPDIQLKVQPENVTINGRLNIPKARITPSLKLEAGGAKINTSNDVSIVDEEKLSEPSQKAWKIKGNMDLKLGDDIRIDVADFRCGMQGGVKMLFEPENLIPKGQGEINIIDGTYKAYGQDLEISQGRIFFQGTPMDNPGLGIRAIRRIKNNAFNAVDVAGIDIRGTAKAPRLSLFSEPKVPDADIISYIVTGSAITGGDIESRELTLGKYISPSFYVSLGYDLFEGNTSFNLRYDINKRWGIEGLAGDRDSGVDVSFTLGRE